MVTKGGRAVQNIWGVDKIIIDKILPIPCYCRFGKDTYRVKAHIEFTPGRIIPDYDDILHTWMTEWYGMEEPIEGVCAKLFDQFMRYQPLELVVEAHGCQGLNPTIIKRYPSDRHYELIDPKECLGADVEQLGS